MNTISPDKRYYLLNLTDYHHGQTLLHQAVQSRYSDLVAFILEHNSDLLNMRNLCGYNALHYATLQGDANIVKHLLNQDAIEPFLLTDIDNEVNTTSLHLAFRQGHMDVIKAFFQSKHYEKLKIQHDASGKNPLDVLMLSYYQASNTSAKRQALNSTLEMLAEQYPQYLTKLLNDQGNTTSKAINVAIRNNDNNMTRWLIEEGGALINYKRKHNNTVRPDINSTLGHANFYSQQMLEWPLDYMIQHPNVITKQQNYIYTDMLLGVYDCMHYGSKRDHSNMNYDKLSQKANKLIQQGAQVSDVLKTVKNDPDSLSFFATHNWYEVFKHLPNSIKLNPEWTNQQGEILLHIAAKHQSLETFASLINLGADPCQLDAQQNMPIDYLSQQQCQGVKGLLL